MKNMINWFEIPAKEIERAIAFYETILDIEIDRNNIMGSAMGFLPGNQETVSGAIVQGDDYTPSMEGSLIYLNGGDNLEIPLSKVEQAGGKVLLPKTAISPEFGFFAIFIDSEGNRMAFHSQN